MITAISRGFIRLKMGDRSVTIGGEGHLPGPGSGGFVIYAKGIRRWDPPHEGVAISATEKEQILQTLETCAAERGMELDIVGRDG
jgi:hypothetical protein